MLTFFFSCWIAFCTSSVNSALVDSYWISLQAPCLNKLAFRAFCFLQWVIMRKKKSANQMVTLTKSRHTRPWSWTSVLHKCEKSNFYYLNRSDSLELLIVDVYRYLCLISFGMFAYAFDVCSLQAWKTSKVLVSRWAFFLSISFSLFTIFICVFSRHVHGGQGYLKGQSVLFFYQVSLSSNLGLVATAFVDWAIYLFALSIYF